MSTHPTDDELRPIIRELLRELLATWPAPTAPPVPAAGPDTTVVLAAKAVLERHVDRAAAAGAKELVIGRHAVLTPLAKDRLRALGLTVRREA